MIYGINKFACTCMCACEFPDPESATPGREQVDFSMAQPRAEVRGHFWFRLDAIRWANARRDALALNQRVDFRSIRTEVKKDGDYDWMAVVTYKQV